MASGGEEDGDGGIPLDIDNVHMLLQVEHDQIQKRTFTNWINAQLAKRCPPSFVSDLFSDLRDGSQLLDLLEVMSGQSMKRQRGRGVFQQRANIETALNFLKRKSIKLVNINIPDILDGRPAIILGLVWSIILHCHIEELANALSFSSRHSSLDSLSSLDSWSSSSVPSSPVPPGRTSPLHRRFRVSAKKALLMWVRDQCQKVRCSVSVKDFKSSWRSGEAFLAILCSLRPQLVDLSLVHARSNQENLEEAFHLAERELHIARLLEPQDVDVKSPDEKSIMTYVAQFLQYSSDMPAPDDHLQIFPPEEPSTFSPDNLPAQLTPALAVSPLYEVSSSERAQEVTCWLQQAYQELSQAWTAAEESSYAEKYQVFQGLNGSFTEQKRPVMTLLATIRRRPELGAEERTLRAAWERLEEELQRCKTDLDLGLPHPLDSVVAWLQRAEAESADRGGDATDHTDAAREARAQQDGLKTLVKEMSHYENVLDTHQNVEDSGNTSVPPEKLDEIRKRLSNFRVAAKHHGIKLEYQESRHTALDLLSRVKAKVQSWKAPYGTQEATRDLLRGWHETVEHQKLLSVMLDALQDLKEKAVVYTSKAALGEDYHLVTRQVKEAESEAELLAQAAAASRRAMERTTSAWETYSKCVTSLQEWLTPSGQSPSAAEATQEMSEWTSCQAQVNQAGNFLIEVTETSASLALTEQLRNVNLQWAERMKKTKFGVHSEPGVGAACPQTVRSLTQEAGCLLRQTVEVACVPLKANRQKLQFLSKKLADLHSSSSSDSSHAEKLHQALPQMLAEAERTCGDVQRAASKLEGRLAELDRWSSDAVDFHSHLKEKRPRGASPLDAAAKALISRGLQLVHQVAVEGRELQNAVATLQRSSPLQRFSTDEIQQRVSQSVSDSQEILELFSSEGFRVGENASVPKQPQEALLVVARTKHVEQAGSVRPPTQERSRISPQLSAGQRHGGAQGGKDVVPQVVFRMTPRPTKESVPRIVKDTNPEFSPQPKRRSSLSDAESAKEGTKPQTPPETPQKKQVSTSGGKPGVKPPQPPAMIRSEVRSRAQSMARSRLEKARCRLQGRIQQAMKLFGGQDVSEAQAKKKQKALSLLQPAVLQEFLGALEGFGAFCSGPQLQDLLLLSDSVRSQWEDVRREMAEFVPLLRSRTADRKRSLSVAPHETHVNAVCRATDPTHRAAAQRQAAAAGGGAASAESLRELNETLTASKDDESAETPPGGGGGRQLSANAPLGGADMSAAARPGSRVPAEQSADVSPAVRDETARPPAEGGDRPAREGGGLKSSLRASEQLLKARVLHVAENSQQTQRHTQAVVSSNTVESKQEAERTLVPETQEERDVEESYRKSCSLFQSQLERNEQLLESDAAPVDVASLENQKKLLQDSKRETESLWFDVELQHAQLSKDARLTGRVREEGGAKRQRLVQEWRDQQMCLQSRMASLESAAHLLESAAHLGTLVAETLSQITRQSVDVSSLTVADPSLFSRLKPMDERMQAEIRKLSEPEAAPPSSSLRQALQTSVHHLERLRQQLEGVQSAARDLDGFLASVREVKAANAPPPPPPDSDEADWEQERLSWQAARRTLRAAAERCDAADGSLKAAGMTLTVDGATVTCQDVLRSVSERVAAGRPQEEAVTPKDQRRRRSSSQEEVEKREDLLRRRDALFVTLKETKAAAEELGLREATLPAVQQRTRALTELERTLSVLLPQLQHVRSVSSQSGFAEQSPMRELEDLWDETTKAVTERREQCGVLTELLRSFRAVRGELSETLQRAESAIGEQASYMGRDNLQRLHAKVEDAKAELGGLGGQIEAVRGVCRQLHSHLRQIPDCTSVPFEDEADTLMDRWLDLSERSDSHLENLRLATSLWDGVLRLGTEVDSWTDDKLAAFTRCPSFKDEDDIKALWNEIESQEENLRRFRRRSTEIQSLLQSAEAPLELQVAETQVRKKLEQLKELVSEAEDVYKQMVATKEQIGGRIGECVCSLQQIQDALLSLRGPDVATVLAKLKDLCWRLHAQDEQAESLLEDVRVVASIGGADSLRGLSASGALLREKVGETQRLFAEVEERTEKSIRELDRLQVEKEELEKWLNAAEKGAELPFTRQQSERTKLLTELASSLRSSSLQQVALLQESEALLRRCCDESAKTRRPPSQDLHVFLALSESTRSWIADVRRRVESSCNAVPDAAAEAEARLEELRVTGAGLSHRRLDGDELKRRVEDEVQETERQWSELLREHTALKADPELPSPSPPACRHEEDELQHQAEQTQDTSLDTAALTLSGKMSEGVDAPSAIADTRGRKDDVANASKVFTIVLDMEPRDALQTRDAGEEEEPRELRESADQRRQEVPTSRRDSQSDKPKVETEAPKPESDDAAGRSPKVFTIVLDMEPQDTQDLSVGAPDAPRCSRGENQREKKPEEVSTRKSGKKKAKKKQKVAIAQSKTERKPCEDAGGEPDVVPRTEQETRPLQGGENGRPDVPRCSQDGEKQAGVSSRVPVTTSGKKKAKKKQKVAISQTKTETTIDEVPECLRGSELQRHEQEEKNGGRNTPDVPRCLSREDQRDTKPTEVANGRLPEKKPGRRPTSASPESDEKEVRRVQTEEDGEDVSGHPAGTLGDPDVLRCSQRADVPGTSSPENNQEADRNVNPTNGKDETDEPKDDESSASSRSRVSAGERLLGGAAETTETTDFCRSEEPAEHSPLQETREAARETQTPAGKHTENSENNRDASPPHVRSERREEATRREQESAATAPERTRETTGESCGDATAMQDIWTETERLVEKSSIINRAPHLDLNWYLKSSPGEAEIRLTRTVQRVLACRYQPAQLSVAAMTRQLEEAEELKRSVQEQVAALKGLEESQRSAAALDASATVQVKAAQLEQVKQYHRLMKINRVFLEVLAAEKDKSSLDALGSSALQAEKLGALLRTMEQKRPVMEELLRLSGQLSVHLSDAESSGALLAQLGDVQEEWRLLEGSMKRALRHASNSTCQSALLLKDAEQLKAKLEALRSCDGKSALEFVCLTTDLKLHHQLYLQLRSQSEALAGFSLGQREKDEIRRSLQALEALLRLAREKLDSCGGGGASTKLNKQLRDLITWAKQAENHVSAGGKLALFPEEARLQIAEMKKFQTDVLTRRSRMRGQFEEMKDAAPETESDEENERVLRTVEDLFEAIADSLAHVLDAMKKNLKEREKLLCELAGMDAWLAETHAKRDPCNHVEDVSGADVRQLESELRGHKLATAQIQSSLQLLESISEGCGRIAASLSPGESRYLVNRLSGLWTELDGLLAHEKATSWELEELVHERTTSDRELTAIQASLARIAGELERQKFPSARETRSVAARLKHVLMEHQCEVQELQHCREAERSLVLCCIGELQDRCKAVGGNALEREKYLHLRRQMSDSKDVAEEQIQRVEDASLSVAERFKLCQTLLVELPLIKTQCQEAADQLEAVAPELRPPDLQAEKETIRGAVDALVSWERAAADVAKNMEGKLLPGLRLEAELRAFEELLENAGTELENADAVGPEERAVDAALQRRWVLWRKMESWTRVLEGLRREGEVREEPLPLRDAVMQQCHSQMVGLSQARESLKDYQWAAQGAIGFLHNAEATFLSAPGGFLDCAEEQRQTRRALEALEDGLGAHILHLVERVPPQPCLSGAETRRLHTGVLSQLLVGRAVLEAQAQLRLESLQRCETSERSHRKCHEDIRQRLSGLEARLSECAAEHVTSYEKCLAQERRAKLLMEDLGCLAGKIEDLRAGCPMQGCGVGKDGELGALWRRWVSLRRGVGLLVAHSEQRGEEWKDITASMEQCCSSLASLQADVPDSSAVSFAQDQPQDLLAQAEMHQAGLEQEQQALASLEHRLEHALSLSAPHEPASPGPVGKTLLKIQENVRSLKERNLLVVAAAQAEENERQHFQEEMEEVEKHVQSILQELDACSSPGKKQELKQDLFSQRSQLKRIVDGVQRRYAEIPADIGRTMRDVHQSLQQTEEKLMADNGAVRKLSVRVTELGSGLEKVSALLEKKSPTVTEAQNVLKRAWDELDAWHGGLTRLESEVQDLAEEQPAQAQLLIDQLTKPLQLYQNAAQMAEHRTAFLNRMPACLQDFEDILFRATCWLDEAQSWLSTPCSFTTARSIQNHAKSLQLVLEDSERLRRNLRDFRSVLAEMGDVCDMSAQEARLERSEQQVQAMQRGVLQPLEELLHAAPMVEAMEAEVKSVEKNIPKIRTILSSMENCYIPLTEHLHNREVILANVQSMRRALEEVERCKAELRLPRGAEEGLLVFSRPGQLLQPLEELEQLTRHQASQLESQISEEAETCRDVGVSVAPEATQKLSVSPQRRLVQEAFELPHSEEEEDEEGCHSSSSSDTLTCSVPEDPEETFNSEETAETQTLSDVKSSTDEFSSVVEMSSEAAETKVSPVKPEFTNSVGSPTVKEESDAETKVSPENATLESPDAASVTAARRPLDATATDLTESLKPEPETPQAAADTRLIPSRPENPFIAQRGAEEFRQEEEEEEVQEEEQEKEQQEESSLQTALTPSSSPLCLLDVFVPSQQDVFPELKDAPDLKCVLGRHLRGSRREEAQLQRASGSLLRGIARLLALGEECIRGRPASRVHSRGRLQAVLCREQKLLRVLGSQSAFVRSLFQRQPEALERQEEERARLQAEAEALRRRALEQDVASQRRLQEWTRWEDNCGQLSRALDESEALIGGEEAEGDDDEESVQRRLDACQLTLLRLEGSRAALGLLLDQGRALQAEPQFAAPVAQTGGALELRWRSARRRTEQEMQRCRDVRESRARFQADFASVSEWLDGADGQLKSLCAPAGSSDGGQDGVRSSLVKLLDFSMEVETMSALKASASRNATRLLHLRDADVPELRAELSRQEDRWNRLTSDLSQTQDQLQQRLQAEPPPAELLSDLEEWLKEAKVRLNLERESVLEAKSAARISEALQHQRALQAAAGHGQLLLDSLCQPGAQATGPDVQARRCERTRFAEKLGECKLQWLHFRRELQSQVCEAQQLHHRCAERERRLRRRHAWIKRQTEQLNEWKRPTSQTLTRRTLQAWEDAVCRVKEAAAALRELKSRRANGGQNEEHPSDASFCEEAESVCVACEDLNQQMDALKPALQQTLEDWSRFHSDLREASLSTTRGRYALQHQRAPLFSLKQAEQHSEFLQRLQAEIGKGEELWEAADGSCQRLVKNLHQEAAKQLSGQVERERKRWEELMQELKASDEDAGKTLSLWQRYSSLSESCSLQLEHLWQQWEELPSSSPGRDAEIPSVKKLQDAAEELQSSVGDVLEASKPLIGRLEPQAANGVQSETRLLSRDVLLLNQVASRRLKRLQEDSEQHELVLERLALLEKATNNPQFELPADVRDTDAVSQVFSELHDLIPSLVELRETSGCATLSEQEAERVRALNRKWIERVEQTSDLIRESQAQRQRSYSFRQKCDELKSIQTKLEEASTRADPSSYSELQERTSELQKLQAELTIGHQLLLGLQSDAAEALEAGAAQKRSDLQEEAAQMSDSWSRCVSATERSRGRTGELLRRWTVYRSGSKLLWKLLRDVDSVLPPTGSCVFTLQQLQSSSSDYQRVEDSLALHRPVYARTLEAGRRLCEAATEPESRSRLRSELQAMEEAWERSASLLRRRREHADTTVQMWTECQDGITDFVSELDELTQKKPLTGGPEDPREEELIQETELSLQRLAGGLKGLSTMKTDLSQYVAAGDSALLEQQLEQLHGQWEELCTKVSLRRQEIADRLNAWTIFNDKNKEFCDWLSQMENKVCRSGELSIEEMVEKLKKDCMEEINLFSENKSHLKQLGEQLLLASDEAKQTQVHGSLHGLNQRWHSLFHHIEARVKKLKETLVTVQQLDKNMSNLRSWLCRVEAELSRPVTYSRCHQQEIQKRLAEQQELQRDIEQHTEGVVSVLSLCDVLLRDEDAGGGGGSTEAESDSLQETSRSLDQRWRTICAMALDRRLRIEETWTLWCKFLNDYSRFEDWLKMAERTAANPNSADVLFTVAKEELKKFEGFQRQVNERLTQLELVNNQYRRLARENRTDRASQLRAMVHEGNRRWDALHRRVAAVLRRLKHFTGQREEFESTRESMLVWLTELDLQLTNVEHFSESDVHHKMQQLNSFQKEITLNTERIDGLIVFGEGLIQKSSPQDAALIEDELEELHSYCQEVFGRLVRFHQRLTQPASVREEPELSGSTFSLEPSLELIGRPLLGRSFGSLPATPTHLLASPLERSGRETPVSVDSLPLEWDHTGDVGGSSSHEDEEDEDEHGEEGPYFSALSAPSRSMVVRESPRWHQSRETQLDEDTQTQAPPTLTSTPVKPGYLRLMRQCSGSVENLKRLSLMLDEDEQPPEFGLTGLSASDKQSGVIERWELHRAQSHGEQLDGPEEPRELAADLDDVTSWLEAVIPELERLQRAEPAAGVEELEARARELKEMQKAFARYKSAMLSVNLRAERAPELQERLTGVNRDWSRACTDLQRWDVGLRKTLLRCQEFHENLHSLLLWLAHAESRRFAVDVGQPDASPRVLRQHRNALTELHEELRRRQLQQAALQDLWSQLRPEDETEESEDAREKLHVTGNRLKLLLRQVERDLGSLQRRLGRDAAAAEPPRDASVAHRDRRDSSPPRSFFHRVLRAAFPLHLLLLLLLLLPCLIPTSESDAGCAVANNFARSFYPMLRYTNGPPPT